MSADNLHSNSRETLHQPDRTSLLNAKEFQEVATTQIQQTPQQPTNLTQSPQTSSQSLFSSFKEESDKKQSDTFLNAAEKIKSLYGDLFSSNSPLSQAQQYNLAEIGRQLDISQQLDSTPSKLFFSSGLPPGLRVKTPPETIVSQATTLYNSASWKAKGKATSGATPLSSPSPLTSTSQQLPLPESSTRAANNGSKKPSQPPHSACYNTL